MAPARVRHAVAGDAIAIGAVHRDAFETDLESRLVALLIERGRATISLVAEVDGRIVGHILFSPATLHRDIRASREEISTGLGLAPVAVMPAFQNQGIGSALVQAGLAEGRRLANVVPAGVAAPEVPMGAEVVDRGRARPSGLTWVVVLGHESYYPRFGFAPARRWKLTGDYGETDAFQFLPLTTAADSARGGHIRYAPEFEELFSMR